MADQDTPNLNPYQQKALMYARQFGLPQEALPLVLATMDVESDGGRNLDVSSAGAHGPMQVLAKDWHEYNQKWFPDQKLDIDNPDHNIMVGVRELAESYKHSNGDPGKTWLGYNAGLGRLQHYDAGFQAAPTETMKAVPKINQGIQKYANLLGVPSPKQASLRGTVSVSTREPLTNLVSGSGTSMSTMALDQLNQSNALYNQIYNSIQRAQAIRQEQINNPRIIADQEAVAQSIKEQQQIYKEAIAQAKKGVTTLEEQLKPYNPPKPTANSGFGSIGMTFALLAAHFTKHPAINSVAAMRGFMGAVNARDKQAQDMYADQWKMNMELAKTRYQAENESLTHILTIAAKQPELARELLQVHSAQYQDALAANAAETNDLLRLGQIQAQRNQAFNEFVRVGEAEHKKAVEAAKEAYETKLQQDHENNAKLIAPQLAVEDGVINPKTGKPIQSVGEFAQIPPEVQSAYLDQARGARGSAYEKHVQLSGEDVVAELMIAKDIQNNPNSIYKNFPNASIQEKAKLRQLWIANREIQENEQKEKEQKEKEAQARELFGWREQAHQFTLQQQKRKEQEQAQRDAANRFTAVKLASRDKLKNPATGEVVTDEASFGRLPQKLQDSYVGLAAQFTPKAEEKAEEKDQKQKSLEAAILAEVANNPQSEFAKYASSSPELQAYMRGQFEAQQRAIQKNLSRPLSAQDKAAEAAIRFRNLHDPNSLYKIYDYATPEVQRKLLEQMLAEEVQRKEAIAAEERARKAQHQTFSEQHTAAMERLATQAQAFKVQQSEFTNKLKLAQENRAENKFASDQYMNALKLSGAEYVAQSMAKNQGVDWNTASDETKNALIGFALKNNGAKIEEKVERDQATDAGINAAIALNPNSPYKDFFSLPPAEQAFLRDQFNQEHRAEIKYSVSISANSPYNVAIREYKADHPKATELEAITAVTKQIAESKRQDASVPQLTAQLRDELVQQGVPFAEAGVQARMMIMENSGVRKRELEMKSSFMESNKIIDDLLQSMTEHNMLTGVPGAIGGTIENVLNKLAISDKTASAEFRQKLEILRVSVIRQLSYELGPSTPAFVNALGTILPSLDFHSTVANTRARLIELKSRFENQIAAENAILRGEFRLPGEPPLFTKPETPAPPATSTTPETPTTNPFSIPKQYRSFFFGEH